jgi:plasmid replication initiation protein
MHELMKSKLFISNEAINAAYDYTALEINVMMHILATAARESYLQKNLTLRLTYAQLLYDAEGSAYNELRQAFKGLLKKPYEVFYKETNQYFISNLITAVTINKNSGLILVDLHPKMYTIITEIKRNYTSFETRAVLGLKSKYAKRLYLLAAQFKNTGVRYVNLDELKKQLALSDKYPKINDFKKRVLEPAIKEINAVTDLSVSYELSKAGRKFEDITLLIKLNNEAAALVGNDKQIKFMEQCGLSKWQIENVLQTLPPSELHPILYQFNLNKDKIKNKGAYLAKILNEAGVPMAQKISKQLTIE